MEHGISIKFTLSIIILIVAVIGITALITQKIDKENNSSNTEKLVSQEVIKNEKTETSDWKTYKSDIYGFELKHPKNWIVIDDFMDCQKPPTVDTKMVSSQTAICSISFASFDSYNPMAGMDREPDKWAKDGVVVTVNVRFNPQQLSIENYIDLDKEGVMYKKQNVIFGKNTFVSMKEDTDNNNYFGVYRIARKELAFEISGEIGGSANLDKKSPSVILNDILKTWQFN